MSQPKELTLAKHLLPLIKSPVNRWVSHPLTDADSESDGPSKEVDDSASADREYPHFNHREDTTPNELFYDLFFVANLTGQTFPINSARCAR